MPSVGASRPRVAAWASRGIAQQILIQLQYVYL